MNKYKRLLLIIPVALLMGSSVLAQTTQVKDSLSVKNQKESGEKANGKVKSNENKGGIKQVRNARADMNQAKGARPPYISRPSGSRIPKGAGKPGGAKGPGKN
ncbi:MAG TPA: hypothetical protein PLR88_07910 [Bacteroidales bacterium]|nr:hypothetical protein [Bacteroidales bacterium]